MSALPSSSTHLSIISRLRTAGCVYAEDEARLLISAARNANELSAMVNRRVAGAPVEHVLGWAEFCGLRILVDPDVFVPRRRTEFLVRQAVARTRPGAVVVDMCCGSGAVGAAMLDTVAGVHLHAVDVDPAAARCARRNLESSGGQVYAGDLFEPLPGTLLGRVDVVVANAPYVPTGSLGLMPAEARLHEPVEALDGGADGLDVHRRLAAEAPLWLAAGGSLLVETSAGQASLAVEIFQSNGLVATVTRSDDFDATVVIGTLTDAEAVRTRHAAPVDPSA